MQIDFQWTEMSNRSKSQSIFLNSLASTEWEFELNNKKDLWYSSRGTKFTWNFAFYGCVEASYKVWSRSEHCSSKIQKIENFFKNHLKSYSSNEGRDWIKHHNRQNTPCIMKESLIFKSINDGDSGFFYTGSYVTLGSWNQ